jgi:REP element-mobilizing transposase RayT
MARRATDFVPGEYYHVYNRGCYKELIFREDENYLYLTRLLNESLRKRHVSMIAYCLMPNHYHFLTRQESDVSISEVMQDVFNAYVKAFNKRYGRTGTLFEERFKAR